MTISASENRFLKLGIKRSYRVTEFEWAAIQAEAQRQDIPPTQFVRNAIKYYLRVNEFVPGHERPRTRVV